MAKTRNMIPINKHKNPFSQVIIKCLYIQNEISNLSFPFLFRYLRFFTIFVS